MIYKRLLDRKDMLGVYCFCWQGNLQIMFKFIMSQLLYKNTSLLLYFFFRMMDCVMMPAMYRFIEQITMEIHFMAP